MNITILFFAVAMVGSTRPATPGVYLVKRGSSVQKIIR